MDDSPNLDLEGHEKEKDLPRWIQVPAGLVLGSLTLLCGYASLVLLFCVNEKSPILAAVVGFVLLLGCLWLLEKCLRLLTGRKVRGGLLSPNALRVVSYFFLIFPVVGLFTGYYRRMGAVADFQALRYLSSFFGLQALARRREANWVMQNVQWQNRAHFFALCARLMRRILVDFARPRHYAKRGGGAQAIPLDQSVVVSPQNSKDLVAVDDALKALAQVDDRKAQVVELRFFGGPTEEKAAEVLKVPPRQFAATGNWPRFGCCAN